MYHESMAALDVVLGDTHCLFKLGKHGAFLRITGNWTGEKTAKLGGIISKAVNELKGSLLLSLEGCRSMDAQAVAMLLKLEEQLSTLGKSLELVAVPNSLRALFEGTRLVPNTEIATASAILRVL